MLGEETEVATATKSAIVAVEDDEGRNREEIRPRRDVNSNESVENLKEAAVDQLKHDDDHNMHAVGHEGAVGQLNHDDNIHAAGPNESDMAAGDPVKLELKPKIRAQRLV
uniref:Uncharacterized protein n=1 Tax=Panagrolaimus superbus TaxID=310955 RepID=A0A914Y2W4_9BILA